MRHFSIHEQTSVKILYSIYSSILDIRIMCLSPCIVFLHPYGRGVFFSSRMMLFNRFGVSIYSLRNGILVSKYLLKVHMLLIIRIWYLCQMRGFIFLTYKYQST